MSRNKKNSTGENIGTTRLISDNPGELSAFLQNVLESSTEYSIIGKDLDGKILLWNEGARRIYGYGPEEVIEKANSSILHTPEDVEAGKPREIMDAALAGGKWEGIIQRVRKDGQRFAARIVITPRCDPSGKPIGFLLISKDISGEQRFSEALHHANLFDSAIVGDAQGAVDFITNILESSTEYSIIGKDLTGRILLWNEGARRLYGYEPGEVVGKANSSILHTPEDVKAGRHSQIIEAALRDGKWEGTLNRVRKSGQRFTARVVITPRRDPSGKPIGFLLISKDISEEIRLTEELKATQFYARSLIEASLDPLVTISPDGKITDVNQATELVTGIPRQRLIGTDFSDYFTESKRAREGYRQVFSQGFVRDYPLAIRHASGKITHVFYNASVYKNNQGNVLGVFAAARDITQQKMAEDLQRASSVYARSLIEASLDPLVTISPEGKITDVNDASVEVTGVARDQLIGTDFSDYFTEPEKARAGYKKVLSEGFVRDYPLSIRHTSGKITDVLYNASVYRDERNRVLGVFAAARDITERKRAEEKQRATLSYARSLIEASLDPLVTISPDGKITDVNQATELVTGVPRQRLIGTDFSDYFTEPEKAREGYQQVFSEGFVRDYPLAIRHVNGKITDVLYNAGVYKDEKGHVLGVFAAARDITQQTTAQELQRASSVYARSLIEASLDPLVTISPEGKITDVNDASVEVTGFPRDQLIGTDFSDYFTEPGKALEGYQRVLQEGFVRDYPLSIRHTSGTVTNVLYNASVYRDEKGNVLGVFAAARDITEQKRLEEQLRGRSEELEEQNRRVQEANRLKSEFLANMSHELRTPLNAVIGFSELMHDGKAGAISATQKEYMGDILTSSKHLHQLINDVLDLSKVESGKMEFQPQNVNMEKLVGEVRDVVRPLMSKKRLRVETVIDPEVASVIADASKLKQVFYNYLSNAIKFTPDGGRITVRVAPENKESFRLEVKDSGIGIGKENMGRLFVEFQQLDAGTAKLYPGTGLGLALTKRIVEAQGGSVRAESTLGQGSSFFAVMPRNPTGVSTRAPEVAPPQGGGASILVIEDEIEERDWLASILAKAGYRVERVENGKKAIELCQKQRFDAITLDLLLPDMSGRDILKAIRSHGANQSTPVVIVTVVPDKGAGAGFTVCDILIKPIRADELLSALKEAGLKPQTSKPILVLDDNPRDLKLVERTLKDNGFRPLCRSDAEGALELAAKQQPALVLLDLMMPGMDGFEFLSRLRATAQGRHIPVIVWTGKDLTLKERHKLKSSVQGMVRKGNGANAIIDELKLHWAQLREPGSAMEAHSG